jgi:hypothetical protein
VTNAGRLEDQLFAIGREISLSVFAAEGQLFQVAKMLFVRQRKR